MKAYKQENSPMFGIVLWLHGHPPSRSATFFSTDFWKMGEVPTTAGDLCKIFPGIVFTLPALTEIKFLHRRQYTIQFRGKETLHFT